MTVIVLEPGQPPRTTELDSSLASMQALAGGLIECLFPFQDAVAPICNEEDKLLGLP